MSVQERCAELAGAYGLPPGSAGRLYELLGILEREPSSVTSVRDPARAVEIHLADSLAGLDVNALRGAAQIADLGSGGGLPGLALAIALPASHVTLVESVGGKARFIARTVETLGLQNAEVVASRAEELGSRDRFEAVTARALGPLPLVLEYAAPVLAPGGTVVAWKGEREEAEAQAGCEAARELGLSEPLWRPVPAGAVKGAEHRHLVIAEKLEATPERFPRRPGAARKRPLGSRA